MIDCFGAYNSDGFLATLELLPMWQAVDPDVDLYGSGVVSEQESEWVAGHPLTATSACAPPLARCAPRPLTC